MRDIVRSAPGSMSAGERVEAARKLRRLIDVDRVGVAAGRETSARPKCGQGWRRRKARSWQACVSRLRTEALGPRAACFFTESPPRWIMDKTYPSASRHSLHL